MSGCTFLFAGQGAQRPGLGLGHRTSRAWEVVERIDDATDADVPGLLLEASSQDLVDTSAAQLAVFSAGLLAACAARAAGLIPTAALGHSVGEVTALVFSGVLGVEGAARFVERRGAAMAEACATSPGAMIALRADPARATALLASSRRIWVAAYNGPGETVLAGHAADVQALAATALRHRVPARILPVAGAFHTPMMAPAVPATTPALRALRFRASQIPVASTVDGRVHTTAVGWPERLHAQFVQPVRWTAAAAALGLGATSTVFDASPGRMLTRLLRRQHAAVT